MPSTELCHSLCPCVAVGYKYVSSEVHLEVLGFNSVSVKSDVHHQRFPAKFHVLESALFDEIDGNGECT